jgi:hypothetical protein
MKQKFILTSIILMLAVSSGFAQFGIGFRVGGASTNLTGIGANVKDFIPDPKLKFVGGGVVNYSFARLFAVQTEILYSGKGSAMQYFYEDQSLRGVVKMDIRLGYLAVPVIAQLKMGDRNSYFHFDFGIVFNQLVHKKYSATIAAEDDKGNVLPETEYLIENFEPNSQDMGYHFGIGLVANGLLFDFAYELGIRDVYPSNTQGLNIRNRAFKISVGYMFQY